MNNVFNRLDPNKYGKFGLGTWNSVTITRNNINQVPKLPSNLNTNPNQASSYYNIQKLRQLPQTNYKPIHTTGNDYNNESSTSPLYTRPIPHARPQYAMTEYTNTRLMDNNKVNANGTYNQAPTMRPQLMDTYSSLTNRFFSPEILKMQILEEKIHQMQKTDKEDKENIRDILEGNQLSQLNGMSNGYSTMNKGNNGLYSNDQEQRELRRMEVKKEIEETRNKLRLNYRGGNDNKNNNDSLSDFDESEAYDDESHLKNITDSFESIKFKKRRRGTITSQSAFPIPQIKVAQADNAIPISGSLNGVNAPNLNQSLLLPNISPTRQRRSTLYPPTVNTEKAREEVHDIINLIPNHTAFQLQSNSFKTRENLLLLKSGLKEMRSEVQSKLEQIEMRQKLNLENIRYALEKGGNTKLRYAMKKYLDKDDINMDEVEDEIPDYIRNLPSTIDEIINEKELIRRRDEEIEMKRYEEERRRIEDEDMIKRAEEEMMKKKGIEDKEAKTRKVIEEEKERKVKERNDRKRTKETGRAVRSKSKSKGKTGVKSKSKSKAKKKGVSTKAINEEGNGIEDEVEGEGNMNKPKKKKTQKKTNAGVEEVSGKKAKKKKTAKGNKDNELNDEAKEEDKGVNKTKKRPKSKKTKEKDKIVDELEPEPEEDIEPKPKKKAKSKSKPPKSNSKSKPKSKSKTKPKPSKSDSKPKSESKPKSKSKPKTKAK